VPFELSETRGEIRRQMHAQRTTEPEMRVHSWPCMQVSRAWVILGGGFVIRPATAHGEDSDINGGGVCSQ